MASEDILPPETFSEDLLAGGENEILENIEIDGEHNMEINADEEDEDETQLQIDTEQPAQESDTEEQNEDIDKQVESIPTDAIEEINTVEIHEEVVTEDVVVDTVQKGNSEPPGKKLLQLPAARVRNIMRLDPDMQAVSSEAIFTVTRATELFIESMAKTCYSITAQHKKKTIQKQDIDDAIREVDSLWFLEGALW